MKAVFLDLLTFGEDYKIEDLPNNIEIVTYPTTSQDELLERVLDCQIVITNKVVFSKETLQKLPELKLIVVSATGTNNIDKNAAEDLGVKVMNVAGYSTASVIQHTLAMAFHFIHPISRFAEFTASGKWVNYKTFNYALPYSELAGKKWGIIGLGTIGTGVAKIASAFDCEVAYYSTSGRNTEREYAHNNLEELLSTSDIISIHCPLNEQTKNLINRSNLNTIKQGAIVINVGRGQIINENDLANYLTEDPKCYFALDVLEEEPMSPNSALKNLLQNERLLVTPHVAWASNESMKRLERGVIENIKEFLNEVN